MKKIAQIQRAPLLFNGSKASESGSEQQSQTSEMGSPAWAATGTGGSAAAGSNEKSSSPTNTQTKSGGTTETNKDANRSGQRGSSKLNEHSLLAQFFEDQLKDIYYAEKLLLQSLPKLQEAASTQELKEAFEDHTHQTRRQVSRLEKIFEMMGKKAEGKKCEAMDGLVRESETIIKETQENTMTRDAALIIAAQKVEHYEIATYGGLVALAITMGKNDIAEVLDRTLVEEENTDRMLTDIAESYINIEANQEEEGEMAAQEKGQAVS